MPDDDAKDKTTDDLDEAPRKAEKPRAIATTDKSGSSATSSSTSPVKAKTKAKPVVEEEDDEEDDEDWEDGEDEEEEPPPPPKKIAKTKVTKGKTAPTKTRPIAARAAVKRADPPTLHVVERLPAQHYIPYALGGLALLALHVYKDFDYQPIAVAGIALSIWAYMGVGSADEIKTLS